MVEIFIPDRVVDDTVHGARIAYWASAREHDGASGYWCITERDTGTTYKASLRNALALMALRYPKRFADMLNPLTIDGDTGDVLVQLACFGELKYG